jgi:DNA invertase Pin-like site-specific DNA recombinase
VIIGYARTSTAEQVAGFEAQIRELQSAGCEKIFQEQVSSVAERAQLLAAIDFAREGDVFTVTKIDRLARSVGDLVRILESLEAKKVGVRILNLGMDTRGPTGKLIVNVLGCVAQFEREMMLERQREGIARAHAEGRYRGRKRTAAEKRAEVLRLAAEGVTRKAIGEHIGISEATVYRILKEEKT